MKLFGPLGANSKDAAKARSDCFYSILTTAFKPLAGRACSEAHPMVDLKLSCGRSVTEYPMPVTIAKPNGTKTEECKAVE